MEKIEVGEVFTISDENDEDEQVEVLASMTLEDTEYVAVSYVEELKDEQDGDIDVFFLKIDEDGGLSAIENDEEFETISTAFDELIDDQEDLDTK